MHRQYWRKIVTAAGFMIVFGLATSGYAFWGGWHHGGGYGWGGFCPGYAANLSQEQIDKLQKERLKFFEDTAEIRQKLFQKRLELGSELAKQEPDQNRAQELQKEISNLKSELDQKRLGLILELRKISPEIGRGFWSRGPMGPGMMGGGYGMGRSMMMGPGMMGPGMMGPGMMGPGMMGPGMMGPGMMGPGMMGPGMMGRGMMGPGMMSPGYGGGYGMGPGMMMGPGYGAGPGMMGPGYGPGMGPARQPAPGARNLQADDAKKVVENYLKSRRNPNLRTGKVSDAGNAFEVEIVTKDNSLVDKVLVDKTSGWIRSAY